MHKTIFTVTGLTCGGCVARVKSTLSTFADEVVVTLDPPEATLANCKADMETLNAALRSPTAHREAETAKAHRG